MSDGNILFDCPRTRHCWVISGNVFVLLGILVRLHRRQQISSPTSWVSSWAIVGYVGFLIPLLAPFSLLASFCVLAGTGNSTTKLRYCILEQNSYLFSGAKWRCGTFSSFLLNSDNLGEVRIDFFSEIPLVLQKIETPRHLRIKKRDCETREIRLKFCETQSFWRTIRHP